MPVTRPRTNTNNIESIKELLTINRSELEAAMAETTHEQKELETNRNTLYNDIDPSYLNSYETLFNARKMGMVSIIGAACGGCYSQLPPQAIIEIRENKQIITCPNCGLFQFWDGAED